MNPYLESFWRGGLDERFVEDDIGWQGGLDEAAARCRDAPKKILADLLCFV